MVWGHSCCSRDPLTFSRGCCAEWASSLLAIASVLAMISLVDIGLCGSAKFRRSESSFGFPLSMYALFIAACAILLVVVGFLVLRVLCLH